MVANRKSGGSSGSTKRSKVNNKASDQISSHASIDSTDRSIGRAGIDGTDSLAVELRQAREHKALTLSDLNRLTGISRTSLHGYESGRSKPGAKELLKLCQVLEVTPNRLLLGTDDLSVKAGGVLVALVRMAREQPTQALAFSAFFLPWVGVILSRLGHEPLIALSTLIDEILKSRDLATYKHLETLISELQKLDIAGMSTMSDKEKQELMTEIQNRFKEAPSP